MINTSNHFQKKQKTLFEAYLNTKNDAYLKTQAVHLSIHGIPLRLHISSEELVSELYDHYPLSWFQNTSEKCIDVFWADNQKLGWTNEEWANEATPDCHVFQDGKKQIAMQRDFAAILENQKCFLVCPQHLDDGFYNFLRWLLPVLLLEKGKVVLHSSCVLDDEGNAYFSLGTSGAGKTTISSMRPRKKILGDDMNIVKFENGRCWAQAGAMGQALLNPTEYSHWYPVKAFFCLKKEEHVELRQLSKTTQIRLMSTSVANVFWNQLSSENAQKIFFLVCSLLQSTPLYELSFPKKQKVWDEIFAALHQEQIK